MRRIPITIALASLFLAAGCSSTRNAASTADDVYYSEGDHQYQPQPATAVSPASPADYSQNNSNYNPDQGTNYNEDYSSSGSSNKNSSESGNTYITNNYYNDDDYYDYEYSARLRRYYTPAIGYGYYDPFYTNSYWYDYNPYNYGVSIYCGYSWWAPSFWYFRPFTYGPIYLYPHHHYYGYYDSWYSPYGYYGYNNYWNGYNHGYYNGYWDGYYNGMYASAYNNPYYYNSYEGNNTYYGPRGSISSNGKTSSPSPRATIGEKYQRAVVENKVPVMDPKGVSGTGQTSNPRTVPASNISGFSPNSGRDPVKPAVQQDALDVVKNPNQTEPVRGSISDKNLNGGKNNVGSTTQTPKDNGGAVKPSLDQPSRSNEFNYSKPKNDLTVNPRNDNGGAVKPNVEQPRNNQVIRPSSQPRNNNAPGRNEIGTPGSTNPGNTFGQPRNQPATPNQNDAKPDLRYEQPKNNSSFGRQRQETQPRIEPRQEPRQYKQESPAPRQPDIKTPPPRQQIISTPAPHQQNAAPAKGNSPREGSGGKKR